MSRFIKQIMGDEPEPLWMSAVAAFIAMFVFPALVLFCGYILKP